MGLDTLPSRENVEANPPVGNLCRRDWTACYTKTMDIHIDESGDFEFPVDRFDAYAIAAVTVPDSEATAVEGVVQRLKARYGVSELHGAKLCNRELEDTCRELAALPIGAVCTLTDTNLIPPGEILDWRLRQAGKLADAWERSQAKASGSAEARKEFEKLLGWIGHRGRISDGEFVEFGALMPQVVADGIQAALFHFRDLGWGPDLERFGFVLDAKLAGKATKAERYLERALPGIMHADRRFVLVSPLEWRDHPEHPFLQAFLLNDGFVDLKRIFVGNRSFEDSRDYPGLQMADVVAHALRRAALAAPGAPETAGWGELKRVVVPSAAGKIRFFASRAYDAQTVGRYSHLL